MGELRQHLIDGMRGQGILLRDQGDELWIRLTDEHLTQIVERLLRTPGIAIVDIDADINKVASAIFHAIERDRPFDETADCVKNNFRRQARAALLAAAVQAQGEQS
jgi:hypothetical protein